jgi:hypothetical protein
LPACARCLKGREYGYDAAMKANQQMHEDQLRYAVVLHWSTVAGFCALIATFVAYMFGWLPSYIPLEKLPQLWSLSTAEYLKATGTPTGWGWLLRMNEGDFASQLGIAILSGCSVVCIAVIMPLYFRDRNKAYLWLCAAEIAVILLSASGVLSRHW